MLIIGFYRIVKVYTLSNSEIQDKTLFFDTIDSRNHKSESYELKNQ